MQWLFPTWLSPFLSPLATLLQASLHPLSALPTAAPQNPFPADTMLILLELSVVHILPEFLSVRGLRIPFLKGSLYFLSHQETGKRVFNQPWSKILAGEQTKRTKALGLSLKGLSGELVSLAEEAEQGCHYWGTGSGESAFLSLSLNGKHSRILIHQQHSPLSSSHGLHTLTVSLGKSFNLSVPLLIPRNGSWTQSHICFYILLWKL